MKKLKYKEYLRHFRNTDHAEYINKVYNTSHPGRRQQPLSKEHQQVIRDGAKSEKVLRKHGLVDKDGQLLTKQKSKVKKKVIKWFTLNFT